MNSKIFNIAHRGFSGKFPENTLLSISQAVEEGAHIVETDLQLTKDNEIVLFHDATVDRILHESQNKSIADFFLKQIKEKDFGSWLNPEFKNCKIATLKEILEFKSNSEKDFDYILEIKGSFPNKIIPKIKDLLDEFNFTFKRGYLSVKDEIAYKIALENGFKNEQIGIMQKKRKPSEIIDLAKQLKAKIIQIRTNNWVDKDWKLLQKSDLLFTIFYADSKEKYQFYSKFSPYGIFTNYPDLLSIFLSLSN